ncbi:Protein TASOR [Vulpes lagopus]
MATAGETEASPPTDASWESGGGGDDEMKLALPELESSPQNGGGGGGGGLSIAEPGGGAGPEETAAASAAPGVSHEQPQDASEAGAAALLKGPEEPERPVRRSFQIPRKSREKKGGASPLPQPLFLSPLHLFIRTSLSPLPTPIRDT